MEDLYIEKIQQMENMCQSWIQKANDACIANGGKACKEQVVCLRKAASIRGDMARYSKGAEKAYYEKMIQELNMETKRAIAEFDPEYFKRVSAGGSGSSPAGNSGKTGGSGSTGSGKASSGSSDDVVSQKDVDKWFGGKLNHGFDAISGMQDVVKKLQACCESARLGDIMDMLEMDKQKSFILVGPPGCGKTFITEAFAYELVNKHAGDEEYTYMKVDGSDILSRYVGDGEKIVARVFDEAMKKAPVVLFFDEIDGVCKDRSKKDLPAYADSLTIAFLEGYNKLIKNEKPVILIGATNYPQNVDRAMLDRVEVVKLGFPDRDARASKFAREMPKKLMLDTGFTADRMAELTETESPYNYRDMGRLIQVIKENVLNDVMKKYGTQMAAMEALEKGEYRLTEELFVKCQSQCEVSKKDEIIKAIDDFFAAKNRAVED